MRINKAIEEAQVKGKGITREEWLPSKQSFYIIPTNTTAGFVVIYGDEAYKNWTPEANDLVAKDWIVRG